MRCEATARRKVNCPYSQRRAAPVQESAALEALRAADPDTLSPRDALDLLFRLKNLDRDQHS